MQGLLIVVDHDPDGFFARDLRDKYRAFSATVAAVEDLGIPAGDPEFLARRRE